MEPLNIETVAVTINVPKQGKEMVDFLATTIEALASGKPKGEIAMGIIAGSMTAVEGYEKLPAEFKNAAAREAIIAYATQKIAAAIDKAAGKV